MNPDLTTLYGGTTISVAFEPAGAESGAPNAALRAREIRVRQIPISDYETGFALAGDEIALVGFLCGQDKAWARSLTPESYEAVLAAGQEANARGFFAFAARRAEELAKREQAAMLVGLQLAQENPALLELAIRHSGSPSPAPSLTSPPRPAA
jgi:hypothetical protein